MYECYVCHIDDEERTNVTYTREVINQDCLATHELLVCDYFSDNYLSNDDAFESRFSLNRTLFLCITNVLEENMNILNKNHMLEVEWALMLYRNVQLHLDIQDTV